jgi:hypothetical protein
VAGGPLLVAMSPESYTEGRTFDAWRLQGKDLTPITLGHAPPAWDTRQVRRVA